MKLKALGIPLTGDHDNCFGIVVSENGELLGQHTSSDYAWLARDLAVKPKVNEYEYIFSGEVPNAFKIFQILTMVLNKQRDTLKWLVKHSIDSAAISKAKGAELLGVSLIDMDKELETIA